MQRPQSAKHGHWTQLSSENWPQQASNNQHVIQKKQVKILRPNLTTNDYSRVMPKKIYHDKEKLYSQALMLKQNVNELKEQNIRLRTRITIIEKEKQKLNKQGAMNENDSNGRINGMYPAKTMEKQNMMIRNLKKMIRQAKQEAQFFKSENVKIKKVIKYTKINELEIERKMLTDENKRISIQLQQMRQQLKDQVNYEREIQELQNQLEKTIEEGQNLANINAEYEEQIEKLQQQLKQQVQKHAKRERRSQRELLLVKKKVNEGNRIIQDLQLEIKIFKQKQHQKQNVQARRKVRPVSSHPYPRNTIKSQLQRTTTENKQNYEEVILENSKLQTQVKQLKQQLSNKKYQSPKKAKTDQNQQQQAQFIIKSKQYQNNEDEYNEDFQKQSQKQKVNLLINDKDIKQHKKDFEQNDQTQQLYLKKQNPEPHHPEEKKKKKKKQNQKKSKNSKSYKPNTKILSQIKGVLTYRMKAQRYQFQDLKHDIQQSQESQFSFTELEVMLRNQPFMLSQEHTNILLQYCFQKQQVGTASMLQVDKLIQKLRKVIGNFDLLPQNQQKQILQKIEQMTRKYAQQLHNAFESIRNGEQTVDHKDLILMFKKLQLDEQSIECIIGQLSLYSQDLDHLNYYSFFQRFYLDNEMINNAIDEQQQQDCHSLSLKQEKNQLQEDQPFIIEQQSPQKNKKKYQLEEEQQVISDN